MTFYLCVSGLFLAHTTRLSSPCTRVGCAPVVTLSLPCLGVEGKQGSLCGKRDTCHSFLSAVLGGSEVKERVRRGLRRFEGFRQRALRDKSAGGFVYIASVQCCVCET